VRSAKRGEEVIERSFVGKVDDREAQAPLVAVAMEKIVVADGHIKQIPRFDTGGIQVGILCAWGGDVDTRRSVLRWCAGCQWGRQRWEHVSAEKACLHLLIRTQECQVHRGSSVGRKRNRASHKTTVVSPGKADPRAGILPLILRVGALLERLVMVDAEDAGRRRSIED
jgi:hypothetical protein